MDSTYKTYYPFQNNYFERNGLKLHYLDEGQGDPIIMVHGNPTWSFYYREVVKSVRDKYRAIVPDHIGCGLSDKPGDDLYTYTLKSRVDDLEALLDHLGLTDNNITLLAHDWGGMIAMAYAHRHPERVQRITLLNTGAFTMPPSKSLPGLLWLVRNTFVGAWMVQGLNFFAGGAGYLGVTLRPLPGPIRRSLTAPYNSWANRIATLRFVQDIPLSEKDPAWEIVFNSQQQLEQGAFTDIPVLLCWGMKDFVFDHHFLHQFKKYWPHAKVVRFEKSGHYVLEENPTEIIGHFLHFLAEHPIPTPTAPAGGDS